MVTLKDERIQWRMVFLVLSIIILILRINIIPFEFMSFSADKYYFNEVSAIAVISLLFNIVSVIMLVIYFSIGKNNYKCNIIFMFVFICQTVSFIFATIQECTFLYELNQKYSNDINIKQRILFYILPFCLYIFGTIGLFFNQPLQQVSITVACGWVFIVQFVNIYALELFVSNQLYVYYRIVMLLTNLLYSVTMIMFTVKNTITLKNKIQ